MSIRGGARVVEWGRLLSGYSGYTESQVRILSLPPLRTVSEHSVLTKPAAVLLLVFVLL